MNKKNIPQRTIADVLSLKYQLVNSVILNKIWLLQK